MLTGSSQTVNKNILKITLKANKFPDRPILAFEKQFFYAHEHGTADGNEELEALAVGEQRIPQSQHI